jgi:hypothetical protein
LPFFGLTTIPSGSSALPRTFAGDGALPLKATPLASLKITVSAIWKFEIAPVLLLMSIVNRFTRVA